MKKQFQASGVIPAYLMPFNADLEMDERAYRRHLSDLAGVGGVSAITVNGHAADVHALSFDEQQKSLAIARDEVSEAVPLVAGGCTMNCREATQLAWMATQCGAMVVEQIDDGDGDFIASVREVVGPDRPIVVTQDLHGNHSQYRVEV